MTKILIVEDENIVAWHIQEALESLEHIVVGIAASGEAAIQLAAELQPELTLMDIQLAGKMDGIATAEEIYTRFSIPVIYLTAHADHCTLQRATKTNLFGYLLKPFQELELHTAIQVALQRHQLEQNLKATQHGLATALSSMRDATIAIDCSGVITFMNPAAEVFTGWQKQEALGENINTVLQLIDQHTHEAIENPGMQAMQTGSPMSLPARCLLRAKDGTEKLVGDTATLIKNYDGEVIGSVLLLQAIGGEQQAQVKLKQQNQILEEYQLSLLTQLQERNTQLQQARACIQLLKQMTQIGASKSLEERQVLQLIIEELGRVLAADYCWVALYDQDYAIANIACEYISSDIEHHPSALGTKIYTQNHLDFYLHLLRKECWLSPPRETLPTVYQSFLTAGSQLLICPISDTQYVIGEVGIVTCGKLPWSQFQAELISQVMHQSVLATRQTHLDHATLNRVKELEMFNSLKDDFIRSVSQELSTPLANMRRALEMFHHLIYLMKRVDVLGSPQMKQSLWQRLEQSFQILQEEWQQEFQIINDLLNFRGDDISIDLASFSIVDFQEWFSRIASRYREPAARKGQLILYEISLQAPLLVPHLPILEQIVTELLSNACKFTPPKQCIKVLVTKTEENLLIIEVINEGIEIPAEELERIFQPFYRIPHPNLWSYSVTGLGLALVKRLALRLGGEVQVDSSNGRTTFFVIIPLTQ